MSRKVFGAVALIVGAALVIAGLLLMQVIVPQMKRFPDDVDTTRGYVGTMPVLLNPATVEFLTDLDVDLERHFRTEATDGDVALVMEEQTIRTPGGPLTLVKHQVIDRKTMVAADEYPASWDNNPNLFPRDGLVMGWPLDTEKKDYDGWSDDYRTTVPLIFAGEVEHDRAGITTYLFTSSTDPMPIHPAQVEAMGMPTELTHAQLAAMIEGLDVAPLIKQSFPQLILMANWPDPVPLVYDYELDAEYWVEPATGVLIDTHKTEIRRAGFPEEQMAALAERLSSLPIDTSRINELLPMTVYHLEYAATDASVAEAAADAEDAKDRIELYGTTLPIALIVVGAILGLLGLVFVLR